MIVLLGVKHTGTTFWRGILEQFYGPYTPLKSDGVFYSDHPYPHKRELILDRLRGRKLIVTDRPRSDVVASWEARGEPLEDMNSQYNELARYTPDLVVSFSDRQSLSKLSEFIGYNFTTDWTPVNGRAD